MALVRFPILVLAMVACVVSVVIAVRVGRWKVRAVVKDNTHPGKDGKKKRFVE
jgi:hypothetical protein